MLKFYQRFRHVKFNSSHKRVAYAKNSCWYICHNMGNGKSLGCPFQTLDSGVSIEYFQVMVVPCLLFIRYTYQQLIELFHQYRLLWEILSIFRVLAFNIFYIDSKHSLWVINYESLNYEPTLIINYLNEF